VLWTLFVMICLMPGAERGTVVGKLCSYENKDKACPTLSCRSAYLVFASRQLIKSILTATGLCFLLCFVEEVERFLQGLLS
jgi:hypothetical protein